MTDHYDPYSHQLDIKFDLQDRLTALACVEFDTRKGCELYVVDGEVDDEGFPMYQGFIYDVENTRYIYQTELYYSSREAYFEISKLLS